MTIEEGWAEQMWAGLPSHVPADGKKALEAICDADKRLRKLLLSMETDRYTIVLERACERVELLEASEDHRKTLVAMTELAVALEWYLRETPIFVKTDSRKTGARVLLLGRVQRAFSSFATFSKIS
jgi:glycyl-tRNA synthetase beta subunit